MSEVRTKGFTRFYKRKGCGDCYFSYNTAGQVPYHETVIFCSKVQPNFIVDKMDICDEYSSK